MSFCEGSKVTGTATIRSSIAEACLVAGLGISTVVLFAFVFISYASRLVSGHEVSLRKNLLRTLLKGVR